MKISSKRFPEIDLWRGVAVILMVVFHVFFVLDFYGIVKNEMRSGFFEIFGDFVRVSFLLLVGISMAISFQKVFVAAENRWSAVFRQWKRAFIVAVCALLVSFVTFFVVPDTYVRFGILHLIAVSIFILAFFAGSKWSSFVFAVFSFILGYVLKDCSLLILPVCGNGAVALDYFPIFPWIGFAALGIFIGRIFYVEKVGGFVLESLRTFISGGAVFGLVLKMVSAIGRQSLLIYILHIPVIIAVFVLFGVISFGKVF
jgi:uncharacterized membrane protein